MRKTRAIFSVSAAVSCLAAIIVAAVLPSIGAGARPAPGAEPYSPSKLEWAAIELNGIMSAEAWGPGAAVSTRFQAGTDGVTLTCFLRYRRVATVGPPDDIQKVVRGVIEQYGQTRGWSWLKVTFDEKVVQ